ncbi:MAG: DEAD/DEAH box helicase [Desulfobacteraceae bacterium]|nr:DEAD/DEAH box helicase [Desulfobacteraceae bacterium]
MMELRKHQVDIIAEARSSISSGKKRIILFAPCSFGKTIVAAEISRLTVEKGGKILFLVHRRLLALQAKEKFDAYGLHSSIVMAGEDTDFHANVIIATVQTLSRRLDLCELELNKFYHRANLIVIDEAHVLMGDMTKKILNAYRGCVVVGLTGSPARGSGEPMGEVYDDIIESVGIKDLTDDGYLAPVRYFAGQSPDLKGVRITAGEYNKKDLEKKMNQTVLIGDVVQTWLEKAGNRPTIVFATGVRHSIHISESFNRAGVKAAHLDASSPHEERLAVLRKFRDGDLDVVSNVGLFTEGYDADFVSCLCIARPTKSLPLWIQMAGRGQRIADDKKDCLLFDFGGNVERHGLLTDEMEWTLDGKSKSAVKKKPKAKEKQPVKCSSCHEVFEDSNKCPICGSEVKKFGKDVDSIDTELKEIDGKKHKATMAEKRRFYGMCLFYVSEKGWSTGAAAHKYREKFGVWPRGMKSMSSIKPDHEFTRYMQYQNIKYAKSRKTA